MKEENNETNQNSISRRKALMSAASLAGIAIVPAIAKEENMKPSNKDSQFYTKSSPPLYALRENNKSRQFTTFDEKTKQKAIPIKPGEKVTLVEYDKPGIINRMWITFSGWFWENWDLSEEKWPDATILKKLILRIYWDGNEYPSVEAPMGDFFWYRSLRIQTLFI